MPGAMIDKIVLKNFKCHKDFEAQMRNLNILTGSNASGKSSLVQAVLLAFKGWESSEKRQVSTNKVFGVNLGIPINIVSEELEQKDIEIGLFMEGIENRIVLDLPEDNEEIYLNIRNYEEIVEQKTLRRNLDKIRLFFLNAERQGPRIVSFIREEMPFSVGTAGENTGFILSEMDKNQKRKGGLRLPEALKISDIDRFSANCEAWLNLIVPETRLRYSVDLEKNFTTLMMQNQGEFHLPVATGFGISYVLPVVVQALAASAVGDSLLIIENPEAHLHPLSQSRLGKFLSLVGANGVQIILETHSEHIIDGCRIQAAKEKQCENMQILFFEKKDNDSVCSQIKIQENGELETWPEGFFDQKRLDLRELLEIRRCGN